MKGPWKGDHRISAGWRYSDGGGHFAWDVACPRGTELYALGSGQVVDCNDGEPDPAPKRYPGMPSNWIILKFTFPAGPYKGKTGYAYYQHLAKRGVRVKRGQRVKKGQLIGLSGSSGNSSGPHLHLVILKPGFVMSRATRYAYLSNPNMVVWRPDVAWGNVRYDKTIDVYAQKLKPGVKNSSSVRFLRYTLLKRGFMTPGPFTPKRPGNDYTMRVSKAVERWQRKKGHKPTGVMTNAQIKQYFTPNTRVELHY